jgi:peptidoglycan/xylan/chitin deacetylase (PgdA/CDA1 family)
MLSFSHFFPKFIGCSLLLLVITLFPHFHFPYEGHGLDASQYCNCVVFRLDDIPYDDPRVYDERSRINIDLAIMNVFIAKNQSVSLALVMHLIDQNPILLKNVLGGHRKGLFELALHGWDHVDYSNLSEMKQENSLLKANKKMEYLFGKPSSIFIPPFYSYNNNTLDAMKRLGIKIISASHGSDKGYDEYSLPNKTKNTDQIYHLPQSASFETWQGEIPIRTPIKQILKDVDSNIAKRGYAVITIHPQSFMKFKKGLENDKNAFSEYRDILARNEVLDTHQIHRLEVIIDKLLSKDIHTTSFSKLVGIDRNLTHYNR